MIKFEVFGTPEPQGSIRAFIPKGWTRPVLTSDNKHLKNWRETVATAARRVVADGLEWPYRLPFPKGVPVYVGVIFRFAKPRSTSKGALFKPTRPDLDKLVRGILDSLTGILYEDDSQVAEVNAEKIFDSPEGCYIEVGPKP